MCDGITCKCNLAKEYTKIKFVTNVSLQNSRNSIAMYKFKQHRNFYTRVDYEILQKILFNNI